MTMRTIWIDMKLMWVKKCKSITHGKCRAKYGIYTILGKTYVKAIDKTVNKIAKSIINVKVIVK
eukprot:2810582-Ditylum_brightwellii.AAC.1